MCSIVRDINPFSWEQSLSNVFCSKFYLSFLDDHEVRMMVRMFASLRPRNARNEENCISLQMDWSPLVSYSSVDWNILNPTRCGENNILREDLLNVRKMLHFTSLILRTNLGKTIKFKHTEDWGRREKKRWKGTTQEKKKKKKKKKKHTTEILQILLCFRKYHWISESFVFFWR